VREARVRQVEDRRPVSRAAPLARGSGIRSKNALHFLELAAHDGGVEAVACNRRIGGKNPLRSVVVHAVFAFAVDLVIPAGRLQERDDALGASNVVRASPIGAVLCQDADGIRLLQSLRPLERRVVGLRPPLVLGRGA
jgi:hypothetical protein